jgi:hypothetical protein
MSRAPAGFAKLLIFSRTAICSLPHPGDRSVPLYHCFLNDLYRQFLFMHTFSSEFPYTSKYAMAKIRHHSLQEAEPVVGEGLRRMDEGRHGGVEQVGVG